MQFDGTIKNNKMAITGSNFYKLSILTQVLFGLQNN